MKTWSIRLVFDSMRGEFKTTELAPSLSAAIANATRYARANGFMGEPVKKFAREIA